MTAAFLITSLVIVATPGTGVLFTVAAGLTRGRRAAVLAALACTAGTLPHLLAGVSGLAALLHTSPIAYAALVWAGIGYLLLMAWGEWRAPALSAGSPTPGGLGILRDGVVVNLLNPKLTLFFLAFLPQFTDDGRTSQLLRLGGVFTLLTLVVFTVYGVSAAALGPRLLRRRRQDVRLGKVFALCYVALAVYLAVQR